MQQEIPPLEGAPPATEVVLPDWLTYVMWAAVAFAAVWLVSVIFIQMRRRATNLTSAHQAGVKKDATPDFMKVDQKARDAAMQRGQAYETELDTREAAEAARAAGKAAKKQPVNMLKTISGMASFAFSLFTLLGAVLGTFRTMDAAGAQLNKFDQIGAVAMKNPIPFVICLFVIGYTIFIWVSQKKWAEPPRI
jgi:prepilin signal peptidase PulO-like enzyme (type II secretory pathway)